MYALYVYSKDGKIFLKQNWLDYEWVLHLYDVAKSCLDVGHIELLDAVTGEIIKHWDYGKGEWFCPDYANY